MKQLAISNTSGTEEQKVYYFINDIPEGKGGKRATKGTSIDPGEI